jgi:hypothetical protein
MGDDYKTTLVFVDPDYLDGGISDAQIRENANGATTTSNTARRIAEHAVDSGGEEEPTETVAPYVDDHGRDAEAAHQSELDRIIAATAVKIGAPGFEQSASYRRSAVYAQAKFRAAVGGNPDDNKYFLAPEEKHKPDPKPATGFVVQTKGRRSKVRLAGFYRTQSSHNFDHGPVIL